MHNSYLDFINPFIVHSAKLSGDTLMNADEDAAFSDLETVVLLPTDTKIPRNGDFLVLTPPVC